MKQLTAFILLLLLLACAKSKKDEYIVVCPEPGFSWLGAKAAEYSSCTCEVNFLQGYYNNQPVAEIRIVDPLCNGINTVYNNDGTELLNSSDQTAYQKYLGEVKNALVVWKCKKAAS